VGPWMTIHSIMEEEMAGWEEESGGGSFREFDQIG